MQRCRSALAAAAIVAAGCAVLITADASTTARAPATATTSTTASAPAGAATCTPLTPGTHRLPSIDGRIPVVLHIGHTAGPGAPLVLGLPGAGQTARDFAVYTRYSVLADREGFSVAYPTATGARPFWNISGSPKSKPDDVAYLRKVIAAALAASCANPARVGVTGVSNGGGMSARMACDAADLLVAAAPVAGGYRSLPDCHPSRPIAILEVHSTADRVVPYPGTGMHSAGSVPAFLQQWRRLDGCSGPVRRTTPFHDAVELRWADCADGTVVQHIRIDDQDHGWPGQGDVDGDDQLSSTRRTWAFIAAAH